MNDIQEMTIDLIEVSGIITSLGAIHLPFGIDARTTKTISQTNVAETDDEIHGRINTEYRICKKDIELARRLVLAGDQHSKVLRGIDAYFDITAPIYWWREMETYRIGRERLSCESTMHIDCRGLQGYELQKAKADIPMGKMHRAIDKYSYQVLRRIYFQRKDHRLPEWREFCKFIETLPFADQLITIQRNETISQENHADTR